MVHPKKLISIGWWVTAFTFPLFSVSFLRINFGNFHLAIPFATLMATAFIFFMFSRVDETGRRAIGRIYRNQAIMVLTLAFLAWHFFAAASSFEPSVSLKESFRISLGIFSFWAVLILMPRDEEFMTKFFTVMAWGMTILLSFLIYKYAFVFHQPFLSSDLPTVHRLGKNQLAYFVVRVAPFVIFMMLYARGRVRKLILPVVITLIAVVYSASRGSWLALAAGSMLYLAGVVLYPKVHTLKHVIKFVGFFAMSLVMALTILSLFVNINTEISKRVLSMYNPSKLPVEEGRDYGRYSYEMRGGRIMVGVSHFIDNPLVGVGLGNSAYYCDGLLHNDYVAVALETGLPGLVMFLAILILVGLNLMSAFLRRGLTSWRLSGSVFSYGALLLISMVYDNYMSAYFWIFLAFYMVASENPTAFESPSLPKDPA